MNAPCAATWKRAAEVDVDEARLARSLFMNWDDARNLVSSGMSIGSHSQTHRALARLSEDEQRFEMTASQARIAAEIQRDVFAFAYPYGWPGAIDATTPRLARESGYRAAFTATEGVNAPGCIDQFALRRVNVGIADAPVLHRARWALHGGWGSRCCEKWSCGQGAHVSNPSTTQMKPPTPAARLRKYNAFTRTSIEIDASTIPT